MTEPQAPLPDWDSLPVLTEIVETPAAQVAELPPQAEVPVLVDFDIPDFDFSAEMAQLAEALPDAGPDFPADLTLDEVLSAGEQAPDAADGALDAEALIGRLPSLDLDVPLPDDMDLGEVLPGFAMPEVGGDGAPAAKQDAVAQVPWPTDRADDAGEVEVEAAPSLAEVPLVTETLAAVFLPGDDLPLSAVETSGDEEMVAAGMPESSLADMDNVPLPDTAEAGLTAAAAAAGLAAWLDQAAALPDAAPQADALAEAEVVPWEASPPVAESAATGTDMGIVATEPVPELTAGSEVPLVTMLDEVPPDLVAAPAGADIAAAGMPQPAPDEAIAATEVTASDGPMADAACPAGDAVAEEGAVTLEPPLLSEPEALPPATGTTAPAAAMDEEPEGDEFAFDLAAAEGAAPVGVAAAYVTALETLPDEAGDDATVHGYPLGRSIPLDSLPTGVLGGGLGLAADLVAGLESDKAGAAVPDREVELAWARDLGAEPPFDLTTQDAILPLQQPLVVPAAMAMPAETGLAAATMQLSGIKEVSQPQVPAPETAPGEAQSPLDAEALTDALYARVLPRMKVELTLWMQDALEMQARQLMSGVMQHLKEDFDMMLAEALRESLREAIREAQAGQGEQ